MGLYPNSDKSKIPTGIPGFDEVLNGGLEKGWPYLLKGSPGSGKTIFGLQFLMEGLKRGEKVIYISFDETSEEVSLQAESFGWDIDVPNFYFIEKVMEMDILKNDLLFLDFDSITEIQNFIKSVTKSSELEEAERVFIDGIGILRDIAKDTSIYRRIVSSIVGFLSKNNVTTLISEEMVREIGKDIISYLISGEFVLERKEREDGEIFRTISVVKYRGGHVHLGRHYFDITPNGIEVYPILPVPVKHENRRGLFSTGDRNFDLMLGGGLYEGSDVIITGKSGVGKTNLCLQILKENDRKGEVGIIYSFEESKKVIEKRYADLFNYTPSKLIIKEVSPYGTNLGRFYKMLIEDTKTYKPKVVVIDPVNPLQQMAFAINELNRTVEILYSYLTATGTTFIQTYEVSEAADVFHFTGSGISYFADYLILGRYMEVNGELLKTITVIKNRYGDHERTIRILDMKSGEGLKIGDPLKDYSGIMIGVISQ